MLVDLPEDVYLAIFAYLDFQDILRVRQTCRKYSELTRLRGLWRDLLRAHILEQNIPVPGLRGRSLEQLDTKEIEQLASRALKLHRNWTSPSPGTIMDATIIIEAGSRIVYLEFLRRPGYQWLLSLSLRVVETVRRFVLQCWDLSGEGATCIASQNFHNFQSIAVNKDPAANAIVAVQSPYITVYTINAHANDPNAGFVPLANFPTITNRRLHLLSGTKLLTRDVHERLHLWDIWRPDIIFELSNPEAHEHKMALGVVVDGDFVILVRPMTCELYALPAINQSVSLVPLATHRWPWRVDSVVVVHQFRWTRSRANLRTPITILMRFGSLFPWPINLLHHFELRPDTFFNPSDGVYADNLPYQNPPILRQTIASPVRLFAATDMTFGPYGTALWIDSHTEDEFGHADHGQRIAARFSPALPVHNDDEEDEDEVTPSDQIATTMAASVMAYNEQDTWVKLAMDEEEGKIAIGSVDGTITVLGFI